MVTISCKKCNQKYKIDDSYAGKTVKCKKCGGHISIPAICLKNDIAILASLIDTSPASPSLLIQEATKSCSFCGETILETAKKCKHCGEFLGKPVVSKAQGCVGKGTIIAAYILSTLAPLFGIISGIYLMVKGKKSHGLIALILSICATFFWLSVTGRLQSFVLFGL